MWLATSTTPTPSPRPRSRGPQCAWCDAQLSLGESGRKGGDSKAVATHILSTAYDYDNGTVLFKPTLTHGAQTFRMDKKGALAYFFGGDKDYPHR